MPGLNVYHVVHSEPHWLVRLEGSPTPSATAETRAEAIEAAGDMLRLLGSGRVVVHAEDGRIERAYSLDALLSPDEAHSRARRWTLAAGVLGLAFVVGLAVAARRR